MISIAAAVWVHVGLLGFLIWNQTHRPATVTSDPPAVPIKLTTVEQYPGEASPRVDSGEMKARIDRGVEQFTALPDSQKISTMERNTRWLEQHSSAQSVEQIGALVRKAYGSPERAYAPAAKPPAGEFDYASMLPYSADRRTDPDGKQRIHQVYVDKDGRTMEQTVRTETMPDGRTRTLLGVRQRDGTWFETEAPGGEDQARLNTTLELVNRSPLLRRLYDTAVLPMVESRQRSGDARP